MKFDDNDSNNDNNSKQPRKSSINYQQKPSKLTTNFNNLLNELEETQEILEKDNSIERELSLSPRSDRIGRRKYSNSSKHDYSRSRSRSRSEIDRWKEISPNSPSSPVEKKTLPTRISSMNPSDKMKLNISQNGRSSENSKSSPIVPSLIIPKNPNPEKQNFEFDDDNISSLSSSYRDDYEYMMNNYSDNPSPKNKKYNDECLSPPPRNQRKSSKPSLKYHTPMSSPDLYSRSYNSNSEASSHHERKSRSRSKSKSKSKKKNSKKYYSDEESEENIRNHKGSHKSRKNKYDDDDNDDDDDIFLYENDVDDYHKNKTSPVHTHSNRAYNENDFDEDESDITISESSDSFTSSEESSFDDESSESEIDDDDIPLKSPIVKPTGIRGRNRHLKKFNTTESSQYIEEKSPVRTSKSMRKSSSVKSEKSKKKRALSSSSRHAPVSPIRSPKENNFYEETVS